MLRHTAPAAPPECCRGRGLHGCFGLIHFELQPGQHLRGMARRPAGSALGRWLHPSTTAVQVMPCRYPLRQLAHPLIVQPVVALPARCLGVAQAGQLAALLQQRGQQVCRGGGCHAAQPRGEVCMDLGGPNAGHALGWDGSAAGAGRCMSACNSDQCPAFTSGFVPGPETRFAAPAPAPAVAAPPAADRWGWLDRGCHLHRRHAQSKNRSTQA